MKLNRGINLGGFLSQCNHDKEHYQTFITQQDIQDIANLGFDHVRLPIDCEVLEHEDGSDNEEDIVHVTDTVIWCKDAGLNIILDLHKAYGYDFNDAGDTAANNLFTNKELQDRFVNLWSKMAKRYSNYKHVAFELLNEVVEKENALAWNKLIASTVDTIRDITQDTLIIYGGIQWNSVKTLKLLDVPKHDNIMFTFHFYEPLIFTHQKAYWVKGMDPEKDIFYPESMDYYNEKSKVLGFQGEVVTKAETKLMGTEFITEMVKEAIDAAEKAEVGLYCGEFGVIDRAPIEDTFHWFQDVNEVFTANNIGFSVWSYKKMDFGFIDKHYDEIRERLLSIWMK